MILTTVGSFVLGGLLGLGCHFWKAHLIKDFEEISENSKWTIWVLPVVTALLAVWTSLLSTTVMETLFNIVIMSLLVLLTCFDFQYMLLPTKIIVPGVVLATLYIICQYLTSGNSFVLINGLIGGLAGFIIFLLIFYGSKVILKKEGLGFGDVRLMAFLGIITGIDKLFLFIIISSVLAVVIGAILLVIRKKSEAFAFGPYLCIGAMIILLYGEQVISLYLRCLGL